MAITKNTVLNAENVEVDMETLRIAQSVRVNPLARKLAQASIVDAVIGALDSEDRQRLEAYENGETGTVYECIACGTTFKEEDGEHENGYLVCPSCWCEDLREVTS